MIDVEGLEKRYGAKTAVAGVSFSVGPGEVFGLLGPNGAGKSTTIKMLATITRPDAGRAAICGMDIRDRRVRRVIALAPQELNLDRELTVRENLRIYGLLYRVPGLDAAVERGLRAIGLWSERDRMVEHLSGGMQRRVLIARALLSQPRVLFLDEPSIGLDPQIRREIWDLVDEIRRSGVTVILTTHYMDEAEILCDRIGIMSTGRLLMTDSPAKLKVAAGRYTVETLQDGRRKRTLCGDRSQADLLAASLPESVVRPSGLEDAFIALTGEKVV